MAELKALLEKEKPERFPKDTYGDLALNAGKYSPLKDQFYEILLPLQGHLGDKSYQDTMLIEAVEQGKQINPSFL